MRGSFVMKAFLREWQWRSACAKELCEDVAEKHVHDWEGELLSFVIQRHIELANSWG